MAEGLMNALYGSEYEAYSAGVTPTGINPYAVKVMSEIGIDISKHHSKSLEELQGKQFDYVVTVCDHAKESCPFFPGAKTTLHEGFEDPSKLTGTEDQVLAGFRRTRNEINEWLEKNFKQRS